MICEKITKKIPLLFQYMLIFLILTGCASKPSRFGVVFTNNHLDIYQIPDNTQSKVEQLTFTPTIGEYGSLVSKGGDKIVFEAGYTALDENTSELDIEKSQHVYLLDTSSKKLIDITNILEDKYAQVGPDFFMDWSPDQKQFMVIANEGGGYEIKSFLEFVDLDGKNRKQIFIPTTGRTPSLIQTAKWSPDAEKVVLTQGVIGVKQQWENPGSAILIYDIESGKLTQLTDYKDGCLPGRWSPTSQQIVATCSYSPPYNAEGVSGPETVRILDIDKPGQPYEHIAFSSCYDPSWSPDGKQIVFVCDKGTDQAGLFIINSDGNGIREVKLGDLGTPAVLKNPTWSPDGTQIVYVAGNDSEHTNIYSVHPDGSNNYPLTSQEDFYSVISVYPLP